MEITIEDFLASNNYAATTKRTYTDILSQFINDYPDRREMTAGQLINYIENKSGWGNARQCVAIACIKKYLAWSYGQGHPALRARKKRTKGKVPRFISSEIALQFLASFDRHTTKGARDLAICSLLLDTGLRESEICRLQQADTDTEHHKLQVLVKGGNWEWAIFTEETAANIEHWKRFRERLNPQGFLFVHSQTGAGLTPEGLYSIVRTWGKHIGIASGVHDFRRGFATIASENGAPDRIIMEGGRWKSTQMVTRYTRGLKLEAMRQWLPMTKLKDIV